MMLLERIGLELPLGDLSLDSALARQLREFFLRLGWVIPMRALDLNEPHSRAAGVPENEVEDTLRQPGICVEVG